MVPMVIITVVKTRTCEQHYPGKQCLMQVDVYFIHCINSAVGRHGNSLTKNYRTKYRIFQKICQNIRFCRIIIIYRIYRIIERAVHPDQVICQKMQVSNLWTLKIILPDSEQSSALPPNPSNWDNVHNGNVLCVATLCSITDFISLIKAHFMQMKQVRRSGTPTSCSV